jgi:hypothetical protein
VAKAVTEAFVASRVGDIMKDLPEALEGKEKETKVLERVYLLVRHSIFYQVKYEHDRA